MNREWPPLPAAAHEARLIAGLDEVGRGPLAGPVVAAAVVLPPDFPVQLLDDSKKLRPARRLELANLIRNHAAVALAFLPAPEIDRLNILQASFLAMKRALNALPFAPDFALIDGNKLPKHLSCPAEAIVKGDARVAAIAAASIIAKVARDAMMAEAAKLYPDYSFEKHMGYPAPAHLVALRSMGLTPIHRLSYAPCRAIVEGR
ncbi:MAG: ribonuclease HII [Rhabdaerophilum sp.]